MLLLEDGDNAKQISPKDFADMMNIPADIYKKLELSPVFEINPQKTKPDKLNGGLIAPAGKGSKPYIFVERDGITKIVRYYDSRVPDKVNPRISTYEPKRVTFEDQLSIYPKFDLALFMYCLSCCKDSPLNEEKTAFDWHYSFQNKEKKAIGIRTQAAKISKALALVNNETADGGLSDNEIVLTAKGIYAQNTNGSARVLPNPSQKNKTVLEIRADLTELIYKNVDLFLDSADSDVNEFYGMVLDAVDRGIFEVKQSPNSSVRSWYWNGGSQNGKLISDIPAGQVDFDILKGAIEADPNKYYQNVIKALAETKGKENMADFLKKEKAKMSPMEHERQVMQSPVPNMAKEPVRTPPPPPSENLMKSENTKQITGPDTIIDENEPVINVNPMAEGKDPVFVMPEKFNDTTKLLRSFNGGVFPPQNLNKIWYDKIKAGEINQENMKEQADLILKDK